MGIEKAVMTPSGAAVEGFAATTPILLPALAGTTPPRVKLSYTNQDKKKEKKKKKKKRRVRSQSNRLHGDVQEIADA